MKKFLGFTVFICLIAVLASSVSASILTVSPNRETIKGYDEAFMLMYEAIENGDESVDLTALEMTSKDVVRIFGDILISVPEFFYLDNSIQYFYHSAGIRNTITKVNFRYTMTGDALERAKIRYEQELAYIVSLIDEELSEAEKALAVHDYMVASFEYDAKLSVYDVYSLFTQRKGVCQAYSLAYAAVLRELGMEAVVVTSEEMNHAWNLVMIDGKWYHTDLSYDDPAPERPGNVSHENFLLCDESIKNTSDPHYGWVGTAVCDAGDYEGAFRGNVSSAMIPLDGQWYYIDSERSVLAASDFSGTLCRDIYRFRDKWYVEGKHNTYWVGVFSGVSQFLGNIFVNTPDKVIIYSPMTGNLNIFLEADEGDRIFGSWVYKNTLEYMISPSPSITEDTYTGTYEITNFSIEEAGSPLPFDDVLRIDPYYNSVKYVYEQGLFKGVSAEKFAPDAHLTRAMFVTVLGRLCGIDTSVYAVSEFRDVDDGMWYTPYVVWASELGLVNGIGGGLFDPTGEITREQMIKITAGLGRILGVGLLENDGTELLIEDRELVSEWAAEGVIYSAANGLIENSGSLRPQAKATRAEAAGIVAGFAKLSGI